MGASDSIDELVRALRPLQGVDPRLDRPADAELDDGDRVPPAGDDAATPDVEPPAPVRPSFAGFEPSLVSVEPGVAPGERYRERRVVAEEATMPRDASVDPSDPFNVLTPETRLPAERSPAAPTDRLPAAGAARVAPEVAVAAEISESLRLGYHLGSAIERIAGAGDDGSEAAERLREAVWLIERYIGLLEARPLGADIHAVTARLARNGDYIHALGALGSALSAQPLEPVTTPTSVQLGEAFEASPESEGAADPDGEDRYPLGRELVAAGLRVVVFVLGIAAIVLVATLASEWF